MSSMNRDALKVHLEAIVQDPTLNVDGRFGRIAILARQYLEVNKTKQELDDLFDTWNSIVAEVVHRHQTSKVVPLKR